MSQDAEQPCPRHVHTGINDPALTADYVEGHAAPNRPCDQDFVEAHRHINSICRHGYAWPNCNYCHSIEPEIVAINDRLRKIEDLLKKYLVVHKGDEL